MGTLGDAWTSVSNSVSDGASAVADGAKGAYDWSADKAKAGYDWTADKAKAGYDWTADKAAAGYQATRRAVVRGKLWVSDTYKTASDFFGGYPENEDFPTQINYEVFDKAGPPTAPSDGHSAPTGPSTLVPSERSFVYLDVGRWGGGQKYTAQRDFGIVCGRTAVLCAFRTTKGTTGPVTNTYNRPEVDHINDLLTHLGKGKMGPVHVRRFDTAHTILPKNADVTPDRIFVIVGDMHLPVITSLNDNGVQKGTQGPRMGRQPGSDDEDTPERAIPNGEFGDVTWIPAHKSNGGMVEGDAIDWYCKYAGATTAGVHDAQGADIFEQAGPDLSEFVGMLNAYSGFPLHLLQLGDMIDLWMGLERFFVEHPSRVVLDTKKTNPDAVSWINYWTDRTLNGTSQSEHARRFLGFTNGRKNWLYGNHDNYLNAFTPDILTHLSGNLPRQECFDERQTRLFAAHGHKWDSSNRDGATMGQFLTQAAFLVPAVRKREPGGRRACITGAVELFLNNESNPFCVFAMGHTHTGVLTRISIVNQT
jgi:hypothetical protein